MSVTELSAVIQVIFRRSYYSTGAVSFPPLPPSTKLAEIRNYPSSYAGIWTCNLKKHNFGSLSAAAALIIPSSTRRSQEFPIQSTSLPIYCTKYTLLRKGGTFYEPSDCATLLLM